MLISGRFHKKYVTQDLDPKEKPMENQPGIGAEGVQQKAIGMSWNVSKRRMRWKMLFSYYFPYSAQFAQAWFAQKTR